MLIYWTFSNLKEEEFDIKGEPKLPPSIMSEKTSQFETILGSTSQPETTMGILFLTQNNRADHISTQKYHEGEHLNLES